MPAAPTARPEIWPITSVPPPLGVRITSPVPGSAALNFTLADDGGRGTPSAIVALPVQLTDTPDGRRWGVVIDDEPNWPVAADHVRRAARFFATEETGERPALYRVALEPQATATQWLVLFVYSQCSPIGAGGQVASGNLYAGHIELGIAWGLERGADLPPKGLTIAQMDHAGLRALTRGFGVEPVAAATPVRPIANANANARNLLTPPIVLPFPFIERIVDAICASIVLRFAASTTASLRQAVVELPAELAQRQARAAAPALVFALASCQYAAGLLDRAPRFDSAHAGPAQASWQRLAARLDAIDPNAEPPPSFIVLAGDQVYVDATAGLFDPRLIDDRYRAPYENLYGGRHVQDVLRRLPAHMLIDDHEIDDNWAPRAGAGPRRDEVREMPRATRNAQLMQRGVAAYRTQQRDLLAEAPDKLTLWQKPPLGGFDFFLGDTRVHRDPRDSKTLAKARIMDVDQLAQLRDWMSVAARAEGGAPRPRFVATPSMLLPRRLATRESAAAALRSDAWDGYPASLHAVLAHICDKRLGHVVFLSGDEHLSCIATVTLTRNDRPDAKPVTFFSIHSSALYAPYPFANATQHDFADPDDFEFDFQSPTAAAATYHCHVETRFAPGDGFALIRVAQTAGTWTLDVDFDRAEGTTRTPLTLRD